MNQKSIFIGAIALLAALFALGVVLYQSTTAQEKTQATVQNRDALVRFHAPTLGPANAPVQIVEFFDPACEGCRAFYPFVKELMAAHPGQIQLILRYAPFHQDVDQVVKLLEATRKQGKYWETLDVLMEKQPEWAVGHVARLELVWPLIGGLGLDIEQLKRDMASPAIAQLIEQDVADLRALDVRQTPEFFVNGRPLPAFGPDELQKLVEEELAQAGKAG